MAEKNRKVESVLLIDNNDSFVYNLAQIVEESGLAKPQVVPYDDVTLSLPASFDRILISPGPGIPDDFPELLPLVKSYAPSKPILGVCLGFEAILQAWGGKIIPSGKIFHGVVKDTFIEMKEHYLFQGLTDPFRAGLYHSWIADVPSWPEELAVTARAADGIVMALVHKQYKTVAGVQFHPESVMTPLGRRMVENWLRTGR
ncbi:MAG: aminodeoxychorismate/anthranilate synthase component II [Bacteroidales bacterium]